MASLRGEDVNAVDDAVDHGGDDLVAEDSGPAADGQVAGQDQAGVLWREDTNWRKNSRARRWRTAPGDLGGGLGFPRLSRGEFHGARRAEEREVELVDGPAPVEAGGTDVELAATRSPAARVVGTTPTRRESTLIRQVL